MPAARDMQGRFVKGSGSWTPAQHAAHAAAKSAVAFELDQKAVDKFIGKLEQFRGLPLRARMQKATLKAGDFMVPYIKAEGPPNHTGNLRRRTRSRPAKKRLGSTLVPTVGAIAGPTSPHRHLVIRGHRIVTRSGVDTGRRTEPNPYVDRAIGRNYARAMRIVSDVLLTDQSVFGSAGRVRVPRRKSFAPK